MNKYLQLILIIIGSGIAGYLSHRVTNAFLDWLDGLNID